MDLMNVKVLFILGFLVVWLSASSNGVDGVLNEKTMRDIQEINKRAGSFLGLIVPNTYEMNPILQSPSFVADEHFPYLDYSGRRFRFGKLGNQNVVMVMTGLGMVNAAVATELLLHLFSVKGVLHWGIAGNADPDFEIGDVVIPYQWAHTGLWVWQRFGQGPGDELPLEVNGDYTRGIGYLKFSDFNNGTELKSVATSENLLNNVWYQPEEVFPVYGTPEARRHAFWVPVDKHYYAVAKKLESMKLDGCVNSTCLPRPPKVKRVQYGASASVFVDNAAYRQFLHKKFEVTPLDMESAAVALISLQHKTPFIIIRALSDLAGGGSAESNEATLFGTLASQNSVNVVLEFVSLLSS